jgi:Arc/MetJ-type ribon-helix-helix transcriptional regulator
MEKEETTTITFRLPLTLRDLLKEYLSLDTHMNESDFLREAVREKIKRDAPKLYKKLFEEKETSRNV